MGDHAIPFFMDNNVAESVGKLLEGEKHNVVRLRDCMAPDSADPVVAIACVESARVLITHDRDFKTISKRLTLTKRKCRQLHRVALHCSEPHAARRMKDALSVILAEWTRVQASRGKYQMVVEVSEVAIRILR
jgi:predicted nuclease of predicted toxin-antitoxin system